MTKLAPARVAGMMMGLWFRLYRHRRLPRRRVTSLYESVSLPPSSGRRRRAFVAMAALIVLIKPTVRLMSGVK